MELYLMKKQLVKFPTQFHLQPYKGKNDPGVIAFEISDDFIIIKYKNKSSDGKQIYLYTYDRPGKLHVEEMKKRAKKHHGLTTYKNQHVRDDYAAYWNEDLKEFISK
jgi:hypothetical protein